MSLFALLALVATASASGTDAVTSALQRHVAACGGCRDCALDAEWRAAFSAYLALGADVDASGVLKWSHDGACWPERGAVRGLILYFTDKGLSAGAEPLIARDFSAEEAGKRFCAKHAGLCLRLLSE